MTLLLSLACTAIGLGFGYRWGRAEGRREGQVSVLLARRRTFDAVQAILNTRTGPSEPRQQ